MRNKKLEKFVSWLCVLDIAVGVILVSGVFEGSFQWRPFTMFTVLNALWALVYHLLEIRYLKVGGSGVISSAMRFTILINSTAMAFVSILYLGPMHSSLVGPDFLALVLLQYVLPILLVLDYLVGPKHGLRKKQIVYVLAFPLVYNIVAIGSGAAGYGFGLGGAQYPYPFLNVSQLGWNLVITNAVFALVFEYLYCRIWIAIDKIGAER